MEKLYNLHEVAALLGITVRTARDWVHKGIINASKIEGGRRWVVKESELKRLRGE